MADNIEDRADTHIMLLCVDETKVSERMVELYLKDFHRPEHQVVLINVYAKTEMSGMQCFYKNSFYKNQFHRN